jgi:hypothetical protein
MALTASAPLLASVPPPVSATASAEVEPPKPAEIRGKVTVPSGVTAKIDGEEVPILDHTIEVVGPPGSIKTVALLAGKRESKHQVILTAQGPTPSALVLPGPAGKKPPPTPGTTSAGAAPKPPKPGVDRQFD